MPLNGRFLGLLPQVFRTGACFQQPFPFLPTAQSWIAVGGMRGFLAVLSTISANFARLRAMINSGAIRITRFVPAPSVPRDGFAIVETRVQAALSRQFRNRSSGQ